MAATSGSRAARGASRTVTGGVSTAERRGSRPAHTRGEANQQVSDIQRSRLLTAAIGAVDELGYDGASVARITERARISRRTFYELFDNREQCLMAVLESVVGQIETELADAGLESLTWRERMRGGLWIILCFFDRDPAFARLCTVQAQRGDVKMLARRQQILDGLAAAIDAGRGGSARGEQLGALTGQALVGGIGAVLYARLLDLDRSQQHGTLRDLFGELMAMIVLPYAGPKAARREQERNPPATTPCGVAVNGAGNVAGSTRGDVLAEVPMRLTYRTARVLQDVCDHPGSSNRQIAERVEIYDQGQVSKLLARLQRIGLLTNAANGASVKGDPNAWCLTERGEQVTNTIRAHSTSTTSTKTASAAPSVGTHDSREGR